MKTNLPVTNVETVLPEGEFIYSRTNLKGVIEDANEAFARISGYSREEMIGQSHNIVRHPDMPPEAFADLWRDLNAGRPWRGVVKNRRKDGGFYWVIANVSAIHENGRIVGYQSVRSRPTRDEIAAAEAAYRSIRSGNSKLIVLHGQAMKRQPNWLLAWRALSSQMCISATATLALALLAAAELLGFTIPFQLKAAVAGLAGIHAVYFLLAYIPATVRDLHQTASWINGVLTSGDLRRRFELTREDQLGSIARRTDRFVSTMQATLQGILDVNTQVLQSANRVHAGVEHAHEAAGHQNEATLSASANIEQVTVSIGEVAANAQETHQVAERSRSEAVAGEHVIANATTTINALATSVGHAAEQVESLGNRSAEISRIASTIKDVADQTNLLALNAAIEAARAGEQGRGFAVVADEVRKLAERTAQATEDISRMIQSIQSETASAVTDMRAGAQQVTEGVRLVQETESFLRCLHGEMDTTLRMVENISHGSSEQKNSMTDLARNVEQVATMTEQNLATVANTRQAAETLSKAVNRLRQALTQYQI